MAIRRHYRQRRLSMLVPMWYEEEKVSEYVTKIKGELYVDVGSSFGHYSRKLSRNFHRIIAIEADPTIFAYLVEYAPPNCKAVNVAITDKTGSAEFYSPMGQVNFGMGSLLPAGERAEWSKPVSYKCFIVKTMRLDELLSNETHIDLVKVDVEGAEASVLSGALGIMRNISRWVIEIHDPKERFEIANRMMTYDYRVKAIDDRHYAFEQASLPS